MIKNCSEQQTEVKPKPWFLKPKRTPEEIAVEGRSPNRKARIRRPMQARKTASQERKQRIINGVATGKTLETASIDAGCGPTYGAIAMENTDFRAEIEVAREEYRRKTEGVIDESLEAVAKETVRLSLNAEEEKTRLQGGLALLRGRGVLKDTPTVAVNNDNRQTVLNVIVKTESEKELIQDITSGVRRIADHNNPDN